MSYFFILWISDITEMSRHNHKTAHTIESTALFIEMKYAKRSIKTQKRKYDELIIKYGLVNEQALLMAKSHTEQCQKDLNVIELHKIIVDEPLIEMVLIEDHHLLNNIIDVINITNEETFDDIGLPIVEWVKSTPIPLVTLPIIDCPAVKDNSHTKYHLLTITNDNKEHWYFPKLNMVSYMAFINRYWKPNCTVYENVKGVDRPIRFAMDIDGAEDKKSVTVDCCDFIKRHYNLSKNVTCKIIEREDRMHVYFNVNVVDIAQARRLSVTLKNNIEWLKKENIDCSYPGLRLIGMPKVTEGYRQILSDGFLGEVDLQQDPTKKYTFYYEGKGNKRIKNEKLGIIYNHDNKYHPDIDVLDTKRHVTMKAKDCNYKDCVMINNLNPVVWNYSIHNIDGLELLDPVIDIEDQNKPRCSMGKIITICGQQIEIDQKLIEFLYRKDNNLKPFNTSQWFKVMYIFNSLCHKQHKSMKNKMYSIFDEWGKRDQDGYDEDHNKLLFDNCNKYGSEEDIQHSLEELYKRKKLTVLKFLKLDATEQCIKSETIIIDRLPSIDYNA